MKQLLALLNEHLANEEDAVLAIIMESQGSTPRGAGAAMALFADGSFFGTIGGGALEAEVMAAMRDALASRASQLQRYSLGTGSAAGLGMVCGGNASVYLQYIEGTREDARILFAAAALLAGMGGWLVIATTPGGWAARVIGKDGKTAAAACSGSTQINFESLFADFDAHCESLLQQKPVLLQLAEIQLFSLSLSGGGQVYIFGGGHVAAALVPLLESVAFSCTVIDDRAEFANAERFPAARSTLAADFSTAFSQLSITKDDYIVIMTRGHLYDYEVLHTALSTPARYIGMIGSRNKISAVFTRLITEGGHTWDALKRVHAPIGLPIGGDTPEEIALGVAAQLVGMRNGKLE